MARLVKATLSVVIVALVLIIIGAIAAALLANKVVQKAVETAGTKALNVGVDVGKADVSILGGSVDLRNIRVANPPGYTGASLLTLQRVDVTADTGSLLSKEVLIKDMKLDAMELFIEQKGLENNLYDVIKPLREPRKPTGKSLIVDNLEITNVVVHVGLSGLPGQTQRASLGSQTRSFVSGVPFKLAPIRMTELGRHEKMDTTVLISKIVLAVAAGVAEQGGNILPKETMGEITSLLDKAIDVGRIIFGPKDSSRDQQKNDGDLGKTITDGLKDFFGSKKKQ